METTDRRMENVSNREARINRLGLSTATFSWWCGFLAADDRKGRPHRRDEHLNEGPRQEAERGSLERGPGKPHVLIICDHGLLQTTGLRIVI
jgi:hypothetical protein